MYILELNGRELFHTPNINLLNKYNLLHHNKKGVVNFLRTEVPFPTVEYINSSGDTIDGYGNDITGLSLWARSTSYNVQPTVASFVVVNGLTVKSLNGSRGHTLVVLDYSGEVVGNILTYDTYGVGTSGLVNDLNNVTSNNYVILITWDACAVDSNLRSVLVNQFGSKLNTTWSSARYSHIFMGRKI